MKARSPKLAFIPPCVPRLVLKPPTGPEWLHELKYDGWRVQAHKSKALVKLFTRRGHEWTDRFGPIGEAVATAPGHHGHSRRLPACSTNALWMANYSGEEVGQIT
jgi:ATP-dependent DNA ligase